MRPEVAQAERSREVRDAARAWRGAGFIGDDALSRVLDLYQDDRRRFGTGFRVLAFIFTGVAAGALVGLSVFLASPSWESAPVFFAFWAAVMAALTELQRGPGRRASAGAESATAWMAVLFGLAAPVVNATDPSFAVLLIRFLVTALVVCAFAAWRWGDRPFFLGAALAMYGLLTQTDLARLWWIVAALVLIPVCLNAARHPRFAPSHRTGAVIVGGVSILALYVAIHIWSYDQRWIEQLNEAWPVSPPALPPASWRLVAIAGTALLPLGLLAIGWLRRERLLLYGGLLLIGATIATIRLYRAVMPLSFALILVGALCLALALWVRRWLRSGPLGERGGFTADPLFDNTNRTEAIRSVVAMASFTPAAEAPPSGRAFEGGGGSFGGGGATGTF